MGKRNADNAEEYDMLQAYKKLMDDEAEVQTRIKAAKVDLEKKVIAQYPKITIDEIKTILVKKTVNFYVWNKLKITIYKKK